MDAGTMAATAPKPAGLPESASDPFSPEHLENPWPLYETLRETGPVVWLSRWNVCAVARHAEVHRVLGDPGVFISGRGVGVCDYGRVAPPRPPILVLESDPPLHTRLRTVYNQTLSAIAVRALRDHFTAVAETMVAALVRAGSFDAVTSLAQAYPLAVLPDALGIAPQGREGLLPMADLAFNTHGPDNDLRRRSIEALKVHYPYLRDACQRENLSSTGFGARIFEHVDNGNLTPAEADGLMRALLTAGMDTTVHALSAAIHALARDPGAFAMLRADPALGRSAFDEAVRLESPVQTFARTTAEPVELGGHRLDAGQKILMLLGSANRDPRKWSDPDRYDITRRTVGHVGFGLGTHMCAGQMIARLEGEIVLATLARQVSAIEIVGPVTRRHNNVLRGLASLPVRVTAN